MNKTKNNYNIKVIIAIAILIIIILGIYRVGKTYISVYRQEKDLVGSSIPSAPLETITINASQAIEQVTLLHGFVHGFQDVNSIPTSTRERIKSLHTKFWRTGGNTELIEIPELFNVPYITFVLGDKYVWSKQKPWDDWQEYEQYVTSTVLNHPEVTYWDVWGEPDTETGSFGTSFVNMLKVFRRTHDAIRRVKPGVKIIGPSTAGFNKLKMNLFLQFSADNNLRFDGISWHEFGSPNIVPNNVDEVRRMVNSYNLGNPEIHINEFSPYKNHLIPGWTVGWLYYFELANATVTNRACWDVEEGRDRWSDCWYGLDGLFLKDNEKHQPLFWVHNAYAQMEGGERLLSQSSNERTVALATKHDNTKEIRILVGRYEQIIKTSDVTIEITNYPYTNIKKVKVNIQKIPSKGNKPTFLPQPVNLPTQIITLQDWSIKINLPDFQDGDAYSIVITPET